MPREAVFSIRPIIPVRKLCFGILRTEASALIKEAVLQDCVPQLELGNQRKFAEGVTGGRPHEYFKDTACRAPYATA